MQILQRPKPFPTIKPIEKIIMEVMIKEQNAINRKREHDGSHLSERHCSDCLELNDSLFCEDDCETCEEKSEWMAEDMAENQVTQN